MDIFASIAKIVLSVFGGAGWIQNIANAIYDAGNAGDGADITGSIVS